MESKKIIQMNLFTKQKKTALENELMDTRRKGWEGGTDWEFGMDICDSVISKIDNQQGPIV